jgi:hypothetical protein
MLTLNPAADEVYFTIKPSNGILATSFTAGDPVCIGADKLLPIERFLPQPKSAAVKRGRGAGRGAAGGRGGGRGGDRGRGGFSARGGGGRGGDRGRGGGRYVLVCSLSMGTWTDAIRAGEHRGDSRREDVVEEDSRLAVRVDSGEDEDAVRLGLFDGRLSPCNSRLCIRHHFGCPSSRVDIRVPLRRRIWRRFVAFSISSVPFVLWCLTGPTH